MRLIDADALIEDLWGSLFYSDAIPFVEEAETIEAAPVVHGSWINEGTYITTAYGSIDVLRCSNCEMEITVDDYDNYCPNCGAKMDGKAESH